MTTTVTVQTFDEEAEVERINPGNFQPQGPKERVPPHEQRVFHVHQRLAVVVREAPKAESAT